MERGPISPKSETTLNNSNEWFIIRDNNTGIEYDIRSQVSMTMLCEEDNELTTLTGNKTVKPWEKWWKRKRMVNNKLIYAAESGDVETIKDLLNKEKHNNFIADINAKGLNDFTPLHSAVSDDRIEAVKLLLNHKAKVDCLTNSLRTPLHIACNRNSLDIIKILVESGADINAQDNNGNTPCHILSNSGFINSLKWLLEKHPNLTIKNIYGETSNECSASLDIKKLFFNIPENRSNSYNRIAIGSVILRNNRADMVKRVLLKIQLLETKYLNPSKMDDEKIMHTKANPTRIVKILEVVKNLKKMKYEEEKNPNGNKSSISPNKRDNNIDTGTSEDFDIINLIGSGSFGEVFLVKYKKNKVHYAMKVMNKKKMTSHNMVKYAKTECNVLKVSNHPFIVNLHFAFQNENKLFMIMDYCPG